MITDPADVVEVIKQLRVDLDELKNAQPFGYDSLLTYKTMSSDAYDIGVTLSALEVKEYDVTFVHATAKHGALLVLNPYYRLNNPAVMANPVARDVQSNLVSWMKTASNDVSTVWRLRLTSTFTIPTPFYIKLFFDGTDTGTFIVTPL
jgi:hypothetical protein